MCNNGIYVDKIIRNNHYVEYVNYFMYVKKKR